GRFKGRADDGEISGRVRLGVSEAFAVSGLPALLRSTSRDYPQLRIELAIGSSPDLVRDVLEHRLDLAVAINPSDDPRLHLTPLGVQPATWAAAPVSSLPSSIRPADV